MLLSYHVPSYHALSYHANNVDVLEMGCAP